MTSLLTHGIWLPLVLGHSGVDLLDDIRTNGGLENSWESGRTPAGNAIGAVDADSWASSLKSMSVMLIFNSIFKQRMRIPPNRFSSRGNKGTVETHHFCRLSFVVRSVSGFVGGASSISLLGRSNFVDAVKSGGVVVVWDWLGLCPALA